MQIIEAIYISIVIGLTILFMISFTFFIRRFLKHNNTKVDKMTQIQKKLDKIIDLLEEEKTPD